MPSGLPTTSSDILPQEPSTNPLPPGANPEPPAEGSPRPSLESLPQGSTAGSSSSGQYRSKYGDHFDRYISACEAGFKGIINWPSNGGTLEEANAMWASLEGAEDGQLLMLGLRRMQDTSVVREDKCCEYAGWVTALIGMVGRTGGLCESDWQRIIDLEHSAPGYYRISYPDIWVIVL